MAEPRPSITAQISAVDRSIGRLNGTSSNALTPGQIHLETRDLGAAAASLRFLDQHRDWIVAELAARKERGE